MILFFAWATFFVNVNAYEVIDVENVKYFGDDKFDTKCPILILCIVITGLAQVISKAAKYYLNIDFSEKSILFVLTIIGAVIFPADSVATLEEATQVNIIYFAYVFDAIQIIFLIEPVDSSKLLLATMWMGLITIFSAATQAYFIIISFEIKPIIFNTFMLYTLNFCSTSPIAIIPIINQIESYKLIVNLILFEYILSTTFSILSLECMHLNSKESDLIMIIICYKMFFAVLYGLIVGQIVSLLLIYCKLETRDVVILIYGTVFTTLLTAAWLYLPGYVSLIVLCYFIHANLNKLSPASYAVLKQFTNTISKIVQHCVYIYCIYAFLIIGKFYHFQDFYIHFCNYSLLIIIRLILTCSSCWLFQRFFNKSFRLYHSIIIALIPPVSTLTLAFPFHYRVKSPLDTKVKLIHLNLFASFMSNIVNHGSISILIKTNLATNITREKINEMVNNLNSVLESRNVYILMMKYHHNFSDVNWSVVRKITKLRLPSPYPSNVRTLREAVGSMIPDKTTDCCKAGCPMASIKLQYQDNERNSQKILREQLKLLLIRRFKYGMVKPEVMKILLRLMNDSVEFKHDDKFLIRNLEKLLNRNKILECLRYVRDKFFFNRESVIDKPRIHWRRVFYKIRKHRAFVLYIYFTNLALVFGLISNPVGHPIVIISIPYLIIIFLFEFFTHIFAYSWVFIWKDGVARYFKSFWHWIDFICLISLMLTYETIIFDKLSGGNSSQQKLQFYIKYTQYLRIIPLLDPIIPKVLNRICSVLENKILFEYETAVVLNQCYDEMLLMLDRVVSDEVTRSILLKRLTVERRSSKFIMLKVAFTYPWMTVTVKTKLTINACIKAMTIGLDELKQSGFVGTFEYVTLRDCIFANRKKLTMLTKLQPISAKGTFFSIPWIERSIDGGEYLYARASYQHFNPDDILYSDNSLIEGVYVIFSGVVEVLYNPDSKVLEKMRNIGAIPVVDCFETIDFSNTMHQFLPRGSTLGELGWLTGRPYNCTVKAVTEIKSFFIHDKFLREAIDIEYNTLNGTEGNLWRYALKNMVLSMLLNLPSNYNCNAVQLCLKLERSFVPTLYGYTIFYVTEIMEDVILLDGSVADFYNTDVYTAPCHIPRSVTKLSLTSKHTSRSHYNVEAKILIIPFEKLVTNPDLQNRTMITDFAQVTDDGRIRSIRPKKMRKKMLRPIRKLGRSALSLESSLLLFKKYKELAEVEPPSDPNVQKFSNTS